MDTVNKEFLTPLLELIKDPKSFQKVSDFLMKNEYYRHALFIFLVIILIIGFIQLIKKIVENMIVILFILGCVYTGYIVLNKN